MRFNPLLLLVLLGGLVACEKVIDTAGPAFRQQVVLTGLLHPDSLIRVQLQYNAPVNQASGYPPIGDAVVRFYEDGQLLEPTQQVRPGHYGVARPPKPGATYRVVAEVANYGLVEASEIMPPRPQGTLTASPSVASNPNQNPDYTLSWSKDAQPTVYWLGTYSRYLRNALGPGCPPEVNGQLPPGCSFIEVPNNEYNYVVTNSAYPERFNAYFDSFVGGYTYSGFVRFDPAHLLEPTLQVQFTLVNQTPKKAGEGLYFDFMTVGPQYDRYLKTAVQAFQNRITASEDALNNPFAEITPVSGNVQNGLGIFGAYCPQRIAFVKP